MTASKFSLVLLATLPWLLGATDGAIASIGAWLAALLVLAVFIGSQPTVGILRQSALLAALLSVAIGLLQYLGWAEHFSPWLSTPAAGEVYANLRQRNQFAALTALGLNALVFAMPHQTPQRFESGIGGSYLLIGMAVTCLALGNALSASRSGLLQLLALSGLLWCWRASLPVQSLRLMMLAWIVYALMVLMLPWVATHLGHEGTGLLSRIDDSNAFSRLALWGNVVELIAQQPWSGHGWRSLAYAHYSTEFSGSRFMEMLDNAHNLPLHLAVELGIPVALGFCGLLVWAVSKGKPWAETRPDQQFAWGALLVIGIHSMLEYPLWYGPFFMTAVICISVLCSDLWRNWLLAGTQSARSAIFLGVRGLGVALLALTAFVAFDYHRVSQIYLQPDERSSWYADDALGAAKKSVLFKSHAKFAELVITPLSRETAPRVLELSSELVHWSPEPRVIEKLIESSVMMGLDDIAAFHLKRYRVAYPQAYAAWQRNQAKITSAL